MSAGSWTYRKRDAGGSDVLVDGEVIGRAEKHESGDWQAVPTHGLTNYVAFGDTSRFEATQRMVDDWRNCAAKAVTR